jgi:hypothetical protein
MPELSGSELLKEWRKVTEAVVSSAAAVTGHASEVPRELLAQAQRQLELVEEIVDRERRLQRDVADRVLGPLDAAFDLFQQSSAMLARQAEALQSAGRAIETTAGLMRAQSELFEQTVRALREPVQIVKAAAGPAPEGGKPRS